MAQIDRLCERYGALPGDFLDRPLSKIALDLMVFQAGCFADASTLARQKVIFPTVDVRRLG